jgi:hypothetical protein
VTERLRLNTVGIPWDALVANAAELIAARVAGSSTPARGVKIAHEPVVC